jgi:Na+-transporting methylmalonyl-CoA/oxaloacetate decarboxylase gamma subunit
MVVGAGFVMLLLILVIIAIDSNNKKKRHINKKDVEDAEYKIIKDTDEK